MVLEKFCLLVLIFNITAINLIEVRNMYEAAAESKVANMKLAKLLTNVSADDDLLMGYKGAAIMMEAKHVFNPITKLNRFRKGKDIIENAIRRDKENVELRYIRLTIQTNVPGFLGYSSAIKADKNILINKLGELKDKDLKNRIISYLSLSKICSAEELRKINVWKNK